MPAFEDKFVQRAVAMLLEAIYEQDFHDCSYGFRPGRSPHAALHEVRERCMQEGIGWIVEADVSGYFDSIDRTRRQEVLRQDPPQGHWRRRQVRVVPHHGAPLPERDALAPRPSW